MTDKERQAVEKILWTIVDSINKPLKAEGVKKAFLQELGLEYGNMKKYCLEKLCDSYRIKNAEDVERSLSVGLTFEVFTKEHVDILCKLLEADWHYSHEIIASILQKLKEPASVNSLYKAALAEHQYLAYSEVAPLAVKCIWALGDINTKASKEKLVLLTRAENEIISKNAIEQLKIIKNKKRKRFFFGKIRRG